jgi:hypothetical protein
MRNSSPTVARLWIKADIRNNKSIRIYYLNRFLLLSMKRRKERWTKSKTELAGNAVAGRNWRETSPRLHLETSPLSKIHALRN